MMADTKSESVVLPLVARNVKTASAASSASTSDGADFIICDTGEEKHVDNHASSMFEDVKIPIFVKPHLSGNGITLDDASRWIKYGASGIVIELKDLDLFTDGLLNQLFSTLSASTKDTKVERGIPNKVRLEEMGNDSFRNERVAGFLKLEDKEKQLIETEKVVLLEAVNVIRKAAPQMEEISLLVDATSQIDEPFLLVIVGEFNSGKSTFINALLGKRYLKEGVVPTTNEITFLRYSESDSDEKQRCERQPDGQYICYIPAPILKEIIIVDTPGTNVILQRQQRLTEEFIPRADLLIFVISADRPLTESEVAFLRYTQQWRKKVVFVLNKSDIYQNDLELQEATSFISENVQKLLNADNVALYPISARSALESKLSATYESAKEYTNLLVSDSRWRVSSFYKLEKFLYSFLDGSTSMGMERVKLKLETPIGIAERLVSACETALRQDCEDANQDLNTVIGIVSSVKEYATQMEGDGISWRRKILSLVDTTKSRVVELTESSLQLSNLDLVATYVFKGEKSATMPTTSRVQNDILGPALLDANKLLIDYASWLHSSNDGQGRLYRESFEKRWPSLVYLNTQMTLERFDLLRKLDEQCLKVIENFSASSASKMFDQEIREVFLGTFGGLGAAGLSASLLTSVLPTTLEDLLALGLCSAGGLLAISNFPARRQAVVNKVNKAVDALARDLEEAMQKDLLDTITNMENFVNNISKPYQEAAQSRLDKLLKMQDELSAVQGRLRMLQIEIQNLHAS
ncbi:G domain-containing protein [Psidium guajava]|nr:G domain-containing protein [Psidium guajava]